MSKQLSEIVISNGNGTNSIYTGKPMFEIHPTYITNWMKLTNITSYIELLGMDSNGLMINANAYGSLTGITIPTSYIVLDIAQFIGESTPSNYSSWYEYCNAKGYPITKIYNSFIYTTREDNLSCDKMYDNDTIKGYVNNVNYSFENDSDLIGPNLQYMGSVINKWRNTNYTSFTNTRLHMNIICSLRSDSELSKKILNKIPSPPPRLYNYKFYLYYFMPPFKKSC